MSIIDRERIRKAVRDEIHDRYSGTLKESAEALERAAEALELARRTTESVRASKDPEPV